MSNENESSNVVRFCSYCGTKLDLGARFCKSCGNQISAVENNSDVHTKQNNTNQAQTEEPLTERKTVYEGSIHKCPNCGEVLEAFVANCPSCGYEIRGNTASNSVREFYRDLNKATSIAQKALMIRNFPIPNAKEDIIEFMILASSNILGEDEREIFEAWNAKFEQAYQKAQISFRNDSDFEMIQQIYNNCQSNIHIEKKRKSSKVTLDTIIRNIAVCAGIILMIISVIVNRNGGNSSLLELTSYIVLIASATSLIKRGASIIDYAVGAASGLLMIAFSFLLYNGSMGQLCGGIVLIITAVNYFKSLRTHK